MLWDFPLNPFFFIPIFPTFLILSNAAQHYEEKTQKQEKAGSREMILGTFDFRDFHQK